MNQLGLNKQNVNVPGLPDVDLIQERLKQFANDRNAVQQFSPPDAAVEFADRVNSEFFDGPVRRNTKELSGSTALKRPPEWRADQDRMKQLRSDILTSDSFGGALAQQLILGPVGSLFGAGSPLDSFATLSPEEKARRVEETKVEAAAIKNADEARRKLRELSPEQASKLGLPTAPGVDADVQRALDEQSRRRAEFNARRAADAEKRAAEVEAQPAGSTRARWFDMAQRAIRGVQAPLTAATKAAIIAAWELPAETAGITDPGRSNMRAWVETAEETLDKMLPGDRTRDKDYLSEVASASGSFLGYVIAGVLGGGAAAAGLGAAGLAVEQYEDAERYDAGLLQRLISLTLGAGLGATEAIPVLQVLGRYERATGGLVSTALRRFAGGSLTEFLQEFGQSVGHDVIAKIYDENREVDWGGAARAGSIGLLVGGGAGAIVGGARGAGVDIGPGMGRANREREALERLTPEEREALIDLAMREAQTRIDDILIVTEPDVPVAPDAPVAAAVDGGVPVAEDVAVPVAEEVGAARPAVSPAGEPGELSAPEAEDVAVPVAGEVPVPEATAVDTATVAPDVAVPTATEIVPDFLEWHRNQPFKHQHAPAAADEFAHRLVDTRPPLIPPPETSKGKGGTVPVVNERGMVPLTHWSHQPRDMLDPGFAGTNPALRGPERNMGGPRGVYYGAHQERVELEAATSERDYMRLTEDEKAAIKEIRAQGIPITQQMIRERLQIEHRRIVGGRAYLQEGGIGPIRHEVEVRPDDLYNVVEDPLNLYSREDPSIPMRWSLYQDAIFKAGFKGIYNPRSDLGPVAVLYVPAQPASVRDDRYNLPVDEIARPEDFENPSAETFDKGGWAVVTGMQEALGDWNSPENLAANERLERKLNRDKVPYQKVSGAYQGTYQGDSFLVFAPDSYTKRLGEQFKQESILTREGLEYTDGTGRVVRSLPGQTLVGDEALNSDFYSQLPDGTAFSMALDFENATPSEFAAQVASNMTGDTWTSAELESAIESWAEAIENPDSEHPLADEVRQIGSALIENSLDPDYLTRAAERLVEIASGADQQGSVLAGQPGAVAEGAAAAEQGGAGAGRDAVIQRDAAQAGGPTGVGGSVTETPEFRNWFGDSQVVDENGNPLVVYHGSKADFDAFQTGLNKSKDETGIFFTADPSISDLYAGGDGSGPFDNPTGGSVYPVYLSVQNPLVIDFEGRRTGRADAIKQAVDAGHDGALLLNHWDAGGVQDQWVVFDPAQIKSVNNQGSFDPNNPNILAQTAAPRSPVRSGPLPLFPELSEQSFDRWFRGSKVVDENGDPLVVYHGTPSPGFNAFDPARTGTTSVLFSSIETHRQGFFFSETESFAQDFADQRPGGAVMPVFLNVQNPLDVRESLNESVEAVERVMARAMEIDPEINNPDFVTSRVGRDDFWEVLDTPEGGDVFVQAAKELGYDGLRMVEPNHETGETESVWVAFDPEQIKSAETNTGAYDPNNPNIYAQTAAGRSAYTEELTRPAGGVPGLPAAEQNDVRLSAIASNLQKLMNLTARVGRFTLKGANIMGQFSYGTGVVRLRTPNDLSTLVHEAGHNLEASATGPLRAFINSNRSLLSKAATDLYGGDVSLLSADAAVSEGFAEFFRVYVLNPNYSRNNMTALHNEFEQLLTREDPTLKAGLEAVSDQYAAWLQLPSTQLVRNMVQSAVEPGAINRTMTEMADQGFGDWMYTFARGKMAEFVNKYANFDRLVADMLNIAEGEKGASLDLKRAYDPRALLRLLPNSGKRSVMQMTDGVMPYRSTQASTKSLQDILLRYHDVDSNSTLRAIDPARQADFAAYLVVLRGLAEYKRFHAGKIKRPPVNASEADLVTAKQEFERQYGAAFTEAAQWANDYGMALWQKAYDAGFLSDTVYKSGLDRDFYVPLQRDVSDKTMSSSDIGNAAQGQSIVKSFKGSDRDIIDPLDALMAKTISMERVIAENEVKKTLAVLADKAGKVGSLVERVPASKLIGKSFGVDEVAKALAKDDTLTDVDAQDLMQLLEGAISEGNSISLFRSQQASLAGDNVVFFWEKGKLAALQIKDGDIGMDIVNVLNGLGSENLPALGELVAYTSTTFRAAVTGWPDFMLVNFIRDQMSAWILTDVGYKPFVSGLQGVRDEIRNTQWAKQYNAAMGIMGGMNTSTLHTIRVDKDIDALRAKGYLARAFSGKGIGGAIEGMARVIEASETGTRLGIFKKAYERAKADGLTDWEADIEASYMATDYMNYGMHGNRMLAWRRLVPFLNAQLVGLHKMMRTLGADEVRQRKGLNFALRAFFKDVNKLDLSRTERQAVVTGRKAWLKMASLGLISAALSFIFEDDPDYQDTSEYLRATGWVIPTGDGQIFYIPKPFELAVVANFVERAYEHATGDGEAKDRLLRGMAMNLTPPSSPPLVQNIVEQQANYDFFSGRDIVPDYMQALAPELQYNHFTSTFAKALGGTMGWSPMRVDHFFNGMGASAYRDLTGLMNVSDPNRPQSDITDWPVTRRFFRDARRGSTSAQDFWALASTATGEMREAEVSYRRMLEEGRESAAEEYLSTLSDDRKAYALLGAHYKADAKRLNPIYRSRQLLTINSAMRREMLSPLGLENMTDIEDPILLTAREKAEAGDLLSELARREMRNTLIYMQAPGWANKATLPVEPTLELLWETSPRVAEEYENRVVKAKVYSGEFVEEYWPEVRDRLLEDREQAMLGDVVSLAKVMR